MAWTEELKGGHRGRYRGPDGSKHTVEDAQGRAALFRTKTEALNAARGAESAVREGRWRDPNLGQETFGTYARRWFADVDLAPSSMQNYRHHLEEHLLPYFEEMPLKGIGGSEVRAWEKSELGAEYKPSSVRTWRGTLHVIMEDAVAEGLITSNPATRRRGRGRRAGRSLHRAPEKPITTALGALLVAERASLLSGRDDEFVMIVADAFTGLRWGELVGLEAEFVREGSVRVEWQLYELDDGTLLRCPPKEDSYRTIDVPPWLAELLAGQVRRRAGAKCGCHGKRYVFGGLGVANGASQPGVKLKDVAARAEVSAGTVSNVLNRPDSVRQSTRERVLAAMQELGYERADRRVGQQAEHHRRSGFATWVFKPAATGWYPAKAPQPRRPVPIFGEPWPGVPARGRGASERATACWMRVADGLTPHGMRHLHRTLMEELGTPPKLMDERMGHLDGSMQARYTHVTDTMRQRLLDALTEVWEEALNARRALHPRSPVGVLDGLLRVNSE